MASQDWRPFGDLRPARLVKARLTAHYAVQWLARAARAYVAAKPDDSHTSLGWDEALGGLATHTLKTDTRLGLRIADLTLVLLDGEKHSSNFPLNGRTDFHARQWLRAQLTARGMDAGALDAPAPYEIPADPIKDGSPYPVGEEANALAELSTWFGNAHRSLELTRRDIVDRKLTASPVRCWPHHFDVATLTSLDEAGGEHGRSVNAGFSPGDHYYEEPYFYVSPYPYPDAAALPRLPAPGHWHTHEFTAAIAPASRIVAAQNPQRDVETFLHAAIETCIRVLVQG
jgi:Family of unknown function (DUF5996)